MGVLPVNSDTSFFEFSRDSKKHVIDSVCRAPFIIKPQRKPMTVGPLAFKLLFNEVIELVYRGFIRLKIYLHDARLTVKIGLELLGFS